MKQNGHEKKEASELAIGLMSGTSMDGIDGVLISLPSSSSSSQPIQTAIQSTISVPFPKALRKLLGELVERQSIDVDQLGSLGSQLGQLYAQAANQLKQKAGKQPIVVIGCHGQTIGHYPDGKFPSTLQLGNGAVIAQLTGLPVVTDFRSADMAMGGQGAPLAPAFHHAIFSSRDENRAVINLGGIANITHLPASASDDSGQLVTGFDTGPASALMDDWCQHRFQKPFDDGGRIAAKGTIQPALLEKLLTEPYFAKPAPKSTGREFFNLAWLTKSAGSQLDDLAPEDVLATLTALTAESVSQQLNRLESSASLTGYVCGGGVHNKTLMDMLQARCQSTIHSTAELGVDPQCVEACAFAWMAYRTIYRKPGTLPSVTGASKPTITGAIYYPD